MSSLAGYSKAAVFFVLGVFFSAVIVATTHYADAQYQSRWALTPHHLRWIFTRGDVPGYGIKIVAAKCSSTEYVVSGGYNLVGANDGAKVHLISDYPDHYENAYVLYVANGQSNAIAAYSYAGCAPK